MQTISLVLILLLAVVISGAISRMLPLAIPQPLIQILIGGIIGLVADWKVTLDPDIFFLLFLPPLLFLDGWRIPRDEILKDSFTILELALGLVVVTVVGVGFFIDFLVPAMPLAVSFALAAVVSPTDPIAVSAIAQRAPIPKRMMHILEGESLLNDASGLVCLRFAIAAALTGAFSLQEAALDFAWVSAIGIMVGIVVTWSVTQVKDWVSRNSGEESGSQILISLLIPFAAYIGAEHLHSSGILAAVAAGVTMSIIETSGSALAVTRIRRNTVWDTIQFAGNGIIFVILGEQLPSILESAGETVLITGHHNPYWLVVYVVAINAALAILRFVWVWVSFKLTLFWTGRRGVTPPLRIVAAMAFAGVRGVITFAGVLTLPLLSPEGTPFPVRDLAIFLAMGVIIVSLVVASVGLPVLLNGLDMPGDTVEAAAENRVRIAAAEAAIAAIERLQHNLAEGRSDADTFASAASRLMDFYRQRIVSRSEQESVSPGSAERIERELRVAAVRAERIEVLQQVRRRKIGINAARKIVRELDLAEARYGGG